MALRDFSDEDMRKIQNLLDQESRRVNSSKTADDPSYIDKSPDVYVAKTPSGGIPAMIGLEPGYAECEIYKQLPVSFGSDQTKIEALLNPDNSSYTQLVRNVSSSSITNEYVVIKRDKFGFWMVDVGGGGGHAVIRFRVNSLAPYTDEVSSPCEAVLAEVLSVSCQSSSVSVGDEVTIYDPSGCWFNVPIEVLEGASGQAVLMEAGVYEQVPDCVEASEEGCWWLVQHLCCTEELYAD